MNASYPFALQAVAAFLLVVPPGAQEQAPHTREEMERRHRDTKAYIAMLEGPARDGYQKPDEVVKALGLKGGETIADIGSGSGYFTLRLARAVGDTGHVYGVDIDPEMIRYLNRRIRASGLRNVQTVLSEPDDPLLPDRSIDRILIVNTWHHIENQERYLALLKKLLTPGGQIVMIDYQKRDMPVGPPMAMKIARGDLVRQMVMNGFRLVQEYAFLPYQYFLVFAPH
jgi:ubiquinone/menaquinone biosynthesis C-methylase UbiE